ncbi:hypothetical protein CPB97_003585, partial [Podila verticillata]
QLPQVLSQNKDLQELELYQPFGLSAFDGSGELSIKYINFSGIWEDNMGIVQLIRHCPNLETLMFQNEAVLIPILRRASGTAAQS